MKTVDIVLPVYNEEVGIAAFNQSLLEVIRSLEDRYAFRVIYVVDRCRDRSFEVLRELARNSPMITVLHLSRRFGHQMSLVAGMDHSTGDALIMMDCDQQHPPATIVAMLEQFENGYDVVSTERRYDERTSLSKRVTSALFYRIQNMLSPVHLPQGGADFRLVSRKVVRVFQTSIREQEQFLRGLFCWVGFESTSVAFTCSERVADETKYDLLRLIQFSINGVISFSKVPLRFAAVAGIVMSFVSVLYGIYLVFLFLAGRVMPAGYTSIIVISLFLGGLQLLVLGAIGEYIGSIYTEVKSRPLYIVEEIVGAQVEGSTGSPRYFQR